jgi:hypothetical protein
VAHLRLRLAVDEGPIKFEGLVHALAQSLHMLRDVDRAVSGRSGGAVEWTVADLGMNSPSPVAVVVGEPKRKRIGEADERIAERVSAGWVNALAVAERGEVLPPHLSDIGLKHLRDLAANLGNGKGGPHFEATYVERETSAEVSQTAAANVKRLLVPKSKAIGSVIGRLEVVSLHEGYRFMVYDDVTKRAVRCTFPPEDLDEIKSALGARVRVAGIIHRNAKGQPLRVDQPRLTVLPTEGDLPTTDEYVGVDPDFTGDLSTDEYVRRLRDA